MENPLKLPYISNNPSIEIGRHAVSIDEHRAFFRSHLWLRPENPARPFGPKDLQQVWFPGVHCDVGGGYPEKECGLSKIALEWMLDEAAAKGYTVYNLGPALAIGDKFTLFSQPVQNGAALTVTDTSGADATTDVSASTLSTHSR